eukprot:scaffold207809_cov32-Tisochrysis_lutea.AAC.12
MIGERDNPSTCWWCTGSPREDRAHFAIQELARGGLETEHANPVWSDDALHDEMRNIGLVKRAGLSDESTQQG